MEDSPFVQLIEIMKGKNIQFDVGLTNAEIVQIKKEFNVSFPPDLKSFLQIALPVSDSFINWRETLTSNESKIKLNYIIAWPLRGILFDVQNNEFWTENWGEKPTSYYEKEEIVKRNYNNYPQLVPIYSHRYIPCQPNEINNPVFSIYQTDVICYGFNLFDYFAKEFFLDLPDSFNRPEASIRKIPFWSELADC